MNMPFKLYNLSYWKELKIAYLLDPMHILKGISNYIIWKYIFSIEKYTNSSTRYLLVPKTKASMIKMINKCGWPKKVSHCTMDIV